jgi:hypothetical protein
VEAFVGPSFNVGAGGFVMAPVDDDHDVERTIGPPGRRYEIVGVARRSGRCWLVTAGKPSTRKSKPSTKLAGQFLVTAGDDPAPIIRATPSPDSIQCVSSSTAMHTVSAELSE